MFVNTLLSFALLATTLAAYTSAETSNDAEIDERKDRRIIKRDASVIIDHIPVQPLYRSDAPVVYRRITRRRYNPRPKYGPPKSKYRTKPRKPYKKTKKPSIKYGPSGRKKRPSKPRYGPPKSRKPVYGPPKKPSYSYESDSYWNYEDAPSNYEQAYEKPNSFGEPPVDYGGPYASSSNTYPQRYKQHNYDGTNYNSNENFEPADENYNSYNYNAESDYNYAHTKEKPVYVKPEYIDDYAAEDIDPDLLRLIKSNTKPEKSKYRKKQRKPWRPTTTPDPEEEEDDEVIVGGQYAEPPGRYIPKFASDANFGDGDFSPMHFYMNPDRVSTMSSYVNYKNSNMAFSPQNLNDAFSIVEN